MASCSNQSRLQLFLPNTFRQAHFFLEQHGVVIDSPPRLQLFLPNSFQSGTAVLEHDGILQQSVEAEIISDAVISDAVSVRHRSSGATWCSKAVVMATTISAKHFL